MADLLLTDPSAADLVAALERVSPSTMSVPARWRGLLDEVTGNDEGRSQLESSVGGTSGARYVSVAWWTDHRGSKHVRVCGGDTSIDSWQPHYSSLDDDLRPPLWHVFMGRTFRVTRRGEEPRWLVCCACGMTGEPEELAWMGERCGPCHDRREEGQPHPEDGRPTLFVTPGAGVMVAFSPDGKRLASAAGWYNLRVHDLSGGKETVLQGSEPDPAFRAHSNSPMAFSPNGRWLVTGLPQEWIVQWWDLADEDSNPGDMLIDADNDEENRGFTFSPDGRLFATWSDRGHYLVSTGEGMPLESDGWRINCHCTCLAFSPDSKTLAVAAAGWQLRVRLLDTHTWEVSDGPATPDTDGQEEIQFIDFTPDGHWLVCISGDATPNVEHRPPRRRLHLFDLTSRELPDREHPLPFFTRVAALSPDGRYLAHVVHDEQHSPGEIRFFDLVEWIDGGRLEWDPEDAINDLAFSDDGQTLATISAAGVVKLWPWRLLLEG